MSVLDEAIILRLTEYSETSQILTCFGRAAGLLRLIAKGARRSTKKHFAAGLDLLEAGEVQYVAARGDAQLGTLTEWVQHDAFLGLRREPLRLYGGLYAAELVGALTEEGDPHPALYDALLKTLQALDGTEPALETIVRFVHRLLKEIGYGPSLRKCVDCGQIPAAQQPTFFSAAAGGVVCRDCEARHPDRRRLPAGFLSTTEAVTHLAIWFEVLDEHVTYVAGRRFRTAELLAGLLKAGGPQAATPAE